MLKKTLLLLGLLAFAANVAAKKPEPLVLPIAPALPVEIYLTQQELGVDVSNTGAAVTAAAVGGILGALIGSAITSAQVANAEKRVGEMRNLLVDYDFNARFEQAVTEQLRASGVAQDVQVRLLNEYLLLNDKKASHYSAQPNVLMVEPRYAVAANFESLSVRMVVTLVERQAKKNGKLKQVWKQRRMYGHVFPMEKLGGSQATEDAARWTGLGRQQLQALLDRGIEQVVAMLAYDLSNEGLAEAQQKSRGSVQIAGATYPGRTVRSGEGWSWLRSGKHWFIGLQGVEPLSSAWVAERTEAAKAAVMLAAPAAETVAPEASVDAAAPAEPVIDAAAPAAAEVAVEAEAAPAAADATTAPEADASDAAVVDAAAPSADATAPVAGTATEAGEAAKAGEATEAPQATQGPEAAAGTEANGDAAAAPAANPAQ